MSLRVRLPLEGGGFGDAVRGTSFEVRGGEVVALVGESGSGKSLTALSILRLEPPSASVTGRVLFGGNDLRDCSTSALQAIRGKRIGIVYQDPLAAFDPVWSVGEQIAETVRAHLPVTKGEAERITVNWLSRVGLANPSKAAQRYPYELSGGMRQRALLAMALCCEPELLIADEPTTALDVTVQAQILDLLRALKDESGFSVLFITHDMGVVADIADRVIVMYGGEIMEEAAATDTFHAPHHPYTEALIACADWTGYVPKSPIRTIDGNPPRLGDLPDGCSFNVRCPFANHHCREVKPALEAGMGRRVRCHFPRNVRPEDGIGAVQAR